MENKIIKKRTYYFRKCCVKSCANDCNRRSLFTFPTINWLNKNYNVLIKEETFQRSLHWLKATGNTALLQINPLHLSQHYFVCSDHFKDSHFAGSSRKRLKSNACPENLLDSAISEEDMTNYVEKFAEPNLILFEFTIDDDDILSKRTKIICQYTKEQMNHLKDAIHKSEFREENHNKSCDAESSLPNVATSDLDFSQDDRCIYNTCEPSTSETSSREKTSRFVRSKCCALNCNNNNQTSVLHRSPGIHTHRIKQKVREVERLQR